MKKHTEKREKEKKFLKIPSYPGGNEGFKNYIKENLHYPESALQHLIEGTVYLEYSVDNIGMVADEIVIHGIGHGCDEEALRLVRSLKYNPVKNKGVRMKVKMKTRIRFELPDELKPKSSVNFNYTPVVPKDVTNPDSPAGTTYSYTITLE